ncbi:K+-transporting ATPase, C subunit [Desulfosporosinus acidiphilus SJ4]|uniref:Potassium-transporting ATPase KdpC subunit n=1 Tax=Desulfosporosinus acidiphilus (strain DSM 22704 / JCM 16185 / SJ4) TaxID=646529 RepID=I4D2C7_DESAJ|nr:potassium-transporting ATPase subunit KdpC [Desulfosporosinus acidiphilus]AFM39951.1 K+-transporting ATPase, C subunit [Desulfosporosinus acidiphilus SJ4]
MMLKQFIKGVAMLLVMIVLTGIAYPLVVTGLAQLFFPHQANGSLVYKNGKAVGSQLIGQNLSDPKYFQPRPSAAGTNGYDATASGGSNLGPTNKDLLKAVADRANTIRRQNGLSSSQEIPSDLVTASASGLDPDITPEGAMLQVPRIAKLRNLPAATIRNLVQQDTTPRQLGIFGEPRVNVLRLNLDLDGLTK